MGVATRWLDRKMYPAFGNNWDDKLLRERILACLTQEMTVLDLGAGSGNVEYMNFKGHVAKMCGVDLDPRVVDNPMLDEGRIADGGAIPYGDGVFDLVFCDNVLEHLDDPIGIFREVARVLKPGGLFLFKTPNKWHYMPSISRATPHSFHRFVNRLRGRAETETFPTRYRANTKPDVIRLADQSGLSVRDIQRVEGRPEYLRMAWPFYLAGTAYERLVNAHPVFAPLRVLLIGTLQKNSRVTTT